MERFLSKRKSKLTTRAIGPFKVHEKINDNSYKIDIIGEYYVSCTFNVADLKVYFGHDHLENLSVNSLQQGEDDVANKGQ